MKIVNNCIFILPLVIASNLLAFTKSTLAFKTSNAYIRSEEPKSTIRGIIGKFQSNLTTFSGKNNNYVVSRTRYRSMGIENNKEMRFNVQLAQYKEERVCYDMLKPSSERIDDCTQEIIQDPNNARAYHIRGFLYGGRDRDFKAIADFNEAIRLNPQSSASYYYRGLSYQDLKDYDKAIISYTEAILIKPQNCFAYNRRGSSYASLKKYEQAIADYTEAIRQCPNARNYYNDRGLSYANQKKYEKAIYDFTKAIQISPYYSDAFYNRGSSYESMGDEQKALTDYRKAAKFYKINGRDLDYQSTKSKIENLESKRSNTD